MLVRNLIQLLQDMPPDAPVFIESTGNNFPAVVPDMVHSENAEDREACVIISGDGSWGTLED